MRTAILIAALLVFLGCSGSAPAAAQENVILLQSGDGLGNWGPSQRSDDPVYPFVDAEVADDFDVVGQITRVRFSGYNSNIAAVFDVFHGVYVRFYAANADGTPGALQKEYWLPRGDARLVVNDPDRVGEFTATLEPAFSAGGRHFIAAQVVMDPEWQSYWYVWSSRTGNPSGQALYYRDRVLSPGLWTHDFPYGTANCDVAFTLYGTRSWPAPVVSNLSPVAAARSARIHITGQYFQPTRGSGQVFIGGVPAHVSRWSDTSITAYVSESTPLGLNQVQVVTSGGQSNLSPLDVSLRPPQSGRVKWRFQADVLHILHRPSIGPDGTIYVTDAGNLYAIAPDGGLRWLFPIGSGLPTSVGQDGTIYAADMNVIYALNPNGTVKWRFEDPAGTFALAGPTVGPDGNIYAVIEYSLGALALSPQGQLLWNDGFYLERGPLGQEIVFGQPGQLYFGVDMYGTGVPGGIFAYTLAGGLLFHQPDGVSGSGPGVGPDGTVYFGNSNGLYALTSSGQFKWNFPGFFVSSITRPQVGPDGVVYTIWNTNRLWALNPNGSERWLTIWQGILQSVSVSPLNNLLVAGARVTYGEPGYIQAFSVAGQPVWKVDLPFENGNWVVPSAQPRFAPDGQSAYVGTVINDYAADPYCYLYAVDTSAAAAPAPNLNSLALNPAAVTSGGTSTGTVTLTAAAPPGGITVALSSSSSAAAVPASVTVPAGQTSVTFSVSAGTVSAVTQATITAQYGGISRSAVLTINPPPGSDTVTITRAEYTARKGQLRVSATSTSNAAVLKVYVTSTNALIGTLQNKGGGRYEGTFAWSPNPQSITVRSSLGGSASRSVTAR